MSSSRWWTECKKWLTQMANFKNKRNKKRKKERKCWRWAQMANQVVSQASSLIWRRNKRRPRQARDTIARNRSRKLKYRKRSKLLISMVMAMLVQQKFGLWWRRLGKIARMRRSTKWFTWLILIMITRLTTVNSSRWLVEAKMFLELTQPIQLQNKQRTKLNKSKNYSGDWNK